MNMVNDTISIRAFMSQIDTQFKAGVDPIILSPSAMSVLYPFIRRLNPYLSRDKAELLLKLLPVVEFHANAFDFKMPGTVYIARRRFWEFLHFFEHALDCEFNPAKIPASYGEGLELIFESFTRLKQLAKSDPVVKENYKLLSGTLAYLIDSCLNDKLTTPVYPSPFKWRPYLKYDVETLYGFPQIARRRVNDEWLYVNLGEGSEQITSKDELDAYTLTWLLSTNTGERILYRDSEEAEFKIVNGPLFGDFDPWNKK